MNFSRRVIRSAESLDEEPLAAFHVSKWRPSKRGWDWLSLLSEQTGPAQERSLLVLGRDRSWILKLPVLVVVGKSGVTSIFDNETLRISIEAESGLDVRVELNGDAWYVFSNKVPELKIATARFQRPESH